MNIFKRFKICIILAYRFIHVFSQIIYGVWHVSKLSDPIISIFGSAKLPQRDLYAHQANQIATWLVENNMSVLTGGGPGIMEAANCGGIISNQKERISS